MRSVHFVSLFSIIAAMFTANFAHAASPVSLLISGTYNRDSVRGSTATGKYTTGYGFSLMTPSIVKHLGAKKSSSNSGALQLDLDVGMEVGIYHRNQAFDFGSGLQENVAVKVPLILWITLNRSLWIGGGYQASTHQPGYDSTLPLEHYGALGALRINLLPNSALGLAIDGRYNRGFSNILPAGAGEKLDSFEFVTSLRIGRL